MSVSMIIFTASFENTDEIKTKTSSTFGYISILALLLSLLDTVKGTFLSLSLFKRCIFLSYLFTAPNEVSKPYQMYTFVYMRDYKQQSAVHTSFTL